MPPSQYVFAATDLRETSSLDNLVHPPTPPADDSPSDLRMPSVIEAARGTISASSTARADNTAAGMAMDQEDSMYLTPATSPAIGTELDEKEDETERTGYSGSDNGNEHNEGSDHGDDVPKYYCHSRDASSVHQPVTQALGTRTTDGQQVNDSCKVVQTPSDSSFAGSDRMDVDVEQSRRRPRDSTTEPIARTHPNKNGAVLKGLSQVDMEFDRSAKARAWDFSDVRPSMRCPSALFQPYSKFIGKQQSDRHSYNVEVTILTIDMEQCCISGYLLINDLTPEHSRLQTFFTGQIVGGPRQRYSFRTTNPSWGANDKVDIQHWLRFPAWRQLAPYAKRDMRFAFPLNGEPWWTQDHVFMRWKEHFLVPDHKQENIAGASFEGFYYICLSLWEGKISGVYFHSKSEKYQQLELVHETKHPKSQGAAAMGVSPVIEMR